MKTDNLSELRISSTISMIGKTSESLTDSQRRTHTPQSEHHTTSSSYEAIRINEIQSQPPSTQQHTRITRRLANPLIKMRDHLYFPTNYS